MDFFYRYLITVIPINIFEISAAIAGTYFLRKNQNTNIVNRYLVYFLWFTFMVEIMSKYATIAYFSDYEYLGFIKDTPFRRTVWYFNIYSLISYSFFSYYFINLLQSKQLKKRLYYLLLLFICIGIINLITSGVFFIKDSIFTSVGGTILVLTIIIYYYFDLLQNDIVLNLKKQLPVYISIGVLVFYLCLTPLDIFSQYFSEINKMFINVKSNILLFANIIMYGTFIIGFLVCSKKDKSID